MQLGMFMQPVHDVRRDYTKVLEEDRETIILADRLGFLECWIGEHLSAPHRADHRAARLPRDPHRADPEHQARHRGVLSSSPAPGHGREPRRDVRPPRSRTLQMGIGTGSLSSDLELFRWAGISTGVRWCASRSTRSSPSGRTILPTSTKGSTGTSGWRTAPGRSSVVGAFPKPFQRPHPPIAVSLLAPGSRTPQLAGERGWIPISGANLVQPRYVGEHWERYAAGCEAAGRRPDPAVWRVGRSVIVGSSDAEAEDYLLDPEGPMAYWFALHHRGVPQPGGAPSPLPRRALRRRRTPDWTDIARSWSRGALRIRWRRRSRPSATRSGTSAY